MCPCMTLKVILYRSLPILYMLTAMIDTTLWIFRINSFQKESEKIFEDRLMYIGFLLDCAGSIIGIVTGILFYIFVIIASLGCVCAMCAVSDPIQYILERFCQPAILRFMTLNCNCPCYVPRPKKRFLHRVFFLIVSGMLRCTAVIVYITAKPDNKYKKSDQAIFLGELSILCPVFMILFDIYRYRIWWHYRPSCDDKTSCERLSQKHLRFLPYHLKGNNRSMIVPGNQPCVNQTFCSNRQLEHIMIFHSDEYKPQPRWKELPERDRALGIYIGFHHTSAEFAVSIAHDDLKISTKGKLMLGHGIYFARSIRGTDDKARYEGAMICAEIQMGRVKEVPREDVSSVRDSNQWWEDYDTVYCVHTDDDRDEFCVKDPSQVLRWVIIVDEPYDVNVKRFRLDREFENTRCGCI